MAKKISVGIDIGSYQIKVIITELITQKGKKFPKIIGRGLYKSKGVRHGYVMNKDEVTANVIQAVSQAEKEAGISVKKAYVALGGISLEGSSVKSKTMITRADNEITQIDIENIFNEGEENPILTNKKILSSIPLEYKIDNKKVLGNPIGMKGNKLEAHILYINCLEQHFNEIIQAVEEADISVEEIVASPIAGSFTTLNKTQKIAGCVLLNIGAETTSAIVFENNLPISLEVFPFGSGDLTNALALKFKTSLEEAEKIKHNGIGVSVYPRKEIEEVFEKQLEILFELLEAHLKKINRNELLPAGVIISGGGAKISHIKSLAESELNLPSHIAKINFINENHPIAKDSIWSIAYGLCLIGLTAEEYLAQNNFFMIFKEKTKKWVSQFFV